MSLFKIFPFRPSSFPEDCSNTAPLVTRAAIFRCQGQEFRESFSSQATKMAHLQVRRSAFALRSIARSWFMSKASRHTQFASNYFKHGSLGVLDPRLSVCWGNSSATSKLFFFTPPSMRNSRSQFSVISMSFLQILVDFQSISIDFLSFSISFNQIQSVLMNFNQFQSVWLGQNPDLLFLGVLIFLGLFRPRIFLGVLSVFSCFSLVFKGFPRVRRGEKILGVLVVFLGFCLNTKEKKIRETQEFIDNRKVGKTTRNKPMVCQTYGLHAGCLSRKRQKSQKRWKRRRQLQIRSWVLAHQNRTIAIASDFRVDGAKSPEFPQKEGVLGSDIAARNRKSLATFHRTLKSQCSIAFSCLRNRAISGVRDGHRNRKSQKSLRFRCAKSWVVD